MEQFEKSFLRWLKHVNLDPETKEELQAIQGNQAEIEERFYKNLEFGTAGLRGIIGAGTNRMNIYTVRKATQGLANYLNKEFNNKVVVIAYDSRHKSKDFALQAALVLANNNIKVYIFDKIAAIPLLSYAITQLNATAGIVITASHNPKEYNGYKVYGSHGGQVVDEIANTITEEINQIDDELAVEVLDKKEAEKKGLINWLDNEILYSYIDRTKKLVLREDAIKEMADDLKIVYTPLHGTGYLPVTELLKIVGFKNVKVVPEQATADPNFSTVKGPNPEDPAAFELAKKLAKQVNADIIMATDPDADRIGVMAKDYAEEYHLLTGNQLGALLVDYILQMRKLKGNLPHNGIIIKTIVTSTMAINIARKYGIGYLDVLTGFKYIGEKIAEFSKDKHLTFLFGFEESYGFLAGDFIRDKDAVQTALLAAEMAAYYKTKGITLIQRLQQLFEELGYYKEDLVNISLAGIDGKKKINKILDAFRENPPQSLNNVDITNAKDYLLCTEKELKTGQEKATTLPKCNVLHYTLEDGSWFCIRPSGTEPKLKIYFSVKGSSAKEASTKLENFKKDVLNKVDSI